MYENNNNIYGNNSVDDTQHQAYYPQGTPQANVAPNATVSPQQPVKTVRKKNGIGKVIAMIAAVAVIGGGAGFGGAFIASKSMQSAITQQHGGTSSGNTSGSKPDHSSNAGSAGGNTGESRPTLNELQSGVTISHNISTEAEFNSDGTFTYTRDLVAAVRDSVVYIETYVDPSSIAGYGFISDSKEPVAYSAGSGIVISSDGYVLTNAHVIDGGVKFMVHVTTTDPVEGTGVVQEYEAAVLGSDTDTDLAVLKIEAKGLQAAVLGNSDELHLGDDVVVIGNPMGLETSVSKGIVSGLNRQLSSGDWSLPSIQTDAPINSGNSGGAMFNMYGEVVGVVNEKLINDYAESLGFAITINEAKSVIDDLISLGYVTGRPILGVTCLQVSDYVAAVRGMTPGLYISEIDQSLPVAKSDLQIGDTVTKVEGVAVTSVSEVSEILADNDKRPGDTVKVTVVRSDALGRDREVEIDIVLAEYNGN